MNETAPPRRLGFSPAFVRIASCGLIFLAVFAIYRQCKDDLFIEFDDGMYVFRNDTVRSGLSWKNIWWALTATEAANWHPLTWWAHMLDVEFFGMRAGGHVMTNVLLHSLAAVTLFLLLERISGSIGVAAFVALVFAVHPANVESVAWVSQKKSTLSALFAFLALGAYQHYGARPTWRRYWLVVFFYLLSLLAKPMMVSFPLLVCLLDFWPLRRARWPWGSSQQSALVSPVQEIAQSPHWKSLLWLLEKIPFCAMALASSIVTSIVQYHAGAMGDIANVQWPMRIAHVLFSYVRYIGQLLFPHGHALLYPFPPGYSPVLVLSCALALVAISWYAIRNARREPHLLVGWFWFLLTLVPVIGLLQVGSQSMADRYLYIPMIGPLIWMAMAGRSWGARWPAARRIIQLAGTGWIAALAIAAWAQASFWVNTESIMNQAIANTKGNFIMKGALGTQLYHLGRLPEAERLFREALKVKPDNAGLLGQLGATLALSGRYDEAIAMLEKSLRLNPKDAGNHNNLGVFYIQKGRVEEAIHEFSEAVRLKPDYTAAKGNLAGAFAMLSAQSHPPSVPDQPPVETTTQ